ncbi:hypothetical protein BPAE_0112g00210 [Botrytis paeoniae]|uniref:Uncharacterized protein n=1 Tax=Botrytis paeoniae TaxID=278948 RepID=A0A4Z1FMQ4_9HELO|nr:hypothetical protein BPAE_0112g00210 [Botrytis paeoniae]
MMNTTIIPTGEEKPNVAIVKGERDALLVAPRKFREESPPREAYGNTGAMWDNLLCDTESLDNFRSLKIDIRDWSRRKAKDQLDDLQGRDRELFFKEVAKIVLLDGPDKQEFPKGLRRPRALVTILEALLTHHLFATIYPDPFFFLGEEASQILNDIMSLCNISNLGHSSTLEFRHLKGK